jgi:hypothetical protein
MTLQTQIKAWVILISFRLLGTFVASKGVILNEYISFTFFFVTNDLSIHEARNADETLLKVYLFFIIVNASVGVN